MASYILKLLLGSVGPILLMILDQLRDKKVFNKVIDLAKTEIARLDGETLDELAKRNTAYLRLKEAVSLAGIEIRDNLIDLALSIALSGMRVGAL